MSKLPLLGALLVVVACEDRPPEPSSSPTPPRTAAPARTAPPASTGGATTPAQSGLPADIAWQKPAAWEQADNPSPMRKATYKVKGEAGEAEMSVTRAGGSVADNIARWEGQFDGKPKATTTEKEVAGVKVTVVEIAGTFQSGMPGMGATEPKADWAMLAAIAHTEPLYFFKLTGPKKTVDAARGDFDVLVGSITKK
jgi:hypothetical protein